MTGLPPTIERVIDSFSSFPGIGKKTAQRLALHVMKADKETILQFARSLTDAREKIIYCQLCHNYSENDVCHICSDPLRDESVICVVEEPADIILFEKAGYKGFYHVLGGALSPLDGIGPEDLNVESLIGRLDRVKEIIIATNMNIEGDTTALYLSKMLVDRHIKITRLARGVPVGGHLEFVDEATLTRSLSERVLIRDE
ncbi:MAG: recombination protein RecR [Candidatus Marinimicrobia bacterium]|nr:recombination protein RecR [Candidatus Neomarinimicrobiota bacterium]